MNDVPKDEELQAPPRLVEALRQASAERIFVPPTIERTILKAAERQLSPSQPNRKCWWWKALATASAIMVAFALIMTQWQHSNKGPFAAEDLNQDGNLDILDAFTLARQLKQGISPNENLDLNSDATIDDKDVAIIATHVVKLPPGGGS
jgi:hypothetical protein